MRLSISNIAWAKEQDADVYSVMRGNGFQGLEIAPTRIIPEAPYDHVPEIKDWAGSLGFTVSSMQSIWYGRNESLFGTDVERRALLSDTKKAVDLAAEIGCGNLVFGCPKNRNRPEGAPVDVAVVFFKEIGDYAASRGTVIGLEANPPIYNTNFINDTGSAIAFIEKVNSSGFRLNLDMGTMIHNGESADILKGKVHLISHVHISEPGLKPIVHRDLHKALRNVLLAEGYRGFVSIEMGKVNEISLVADVIKYVLGVFFE